MELAVYGRKKIGFCLHAEISVSFFFSTGGHGVASKNAQNILSIVCNVGD